jgi:hypothetical protein
MLAAGLDRISRFTSLRSTLRVSHDIGAFDPAQAARRVEIRPVEHTPFVAAHPGSVAGGSGCSIGPHQRSSMFGSQFSIGTW